MKHSKRLFSSLFYVPKYEKVSEKAFLRIMLSSIFGILICGICLAGLTWAWFTSSISSTANTITAAKFTVNISVIEKETNTPLTRTEEDGAYKYGLTAGKKYTVAVTADESATATTGYCTVELKLLDNNTNTNTNTYHTIQLYPEVGEGKPNSVEFTVSVSGNSELKITPQWGACAEAATAEKPRIGSQQKTEKHIVNSIGASSEPQASVSAVLPEAGQQATESVTTYALTDTEQSYTVQQGDTLSEIANRYGTTAAVLSAYNNIENAAEIKAGDTLKIPPANVAEETTASQTQNLQDDDTSKATTDEP